MAMVYVRNTVLLQFLLSSCSIATNSIVERASLWPSRRAVCRIVANRVLLPVGLLTGKPFPFLLTGYSGPPEQNKTAIEDAKRVFKALAAGKTNPPPFLIAMADPQISALYKTLREDGLTFRAMSRWESLRCSAAAQCEAHANEVTFNKLKGWDYHPDVMFVHEAIQLQIERKLKFQGGMQRLVRTLPGNIQEHMMELENLGLDSISQLADYLGETAAFTGQRDFYRRNREKHPYMRSEFMDRMANMTDDQWSLFLDYTLIHIYGVDPKLLQMFHDAKIENFWAKDD